MFVRYRKLVSDGLQPCGVAAKINCAGRRLCVRLGHCPMKPRCRWRIGIEIVDDGLVLGRFKPYRLQVQLVENRRESGRVRQEHVATLGSVKGWLLPEFWAGIDSAIAGKVKADDWDLRSVCARVAFWETANLVWPSSRTD